VNPPLAQPLLEVRDLKVHFKVGQGALRRAKGWVRAVDGVSFSLAAGETLGLVGESGSGKSTLGRAVLRLLATNAGQIRFEGEDITHLEGDRLREKRRRFQIVFQDPIGSLNPSLTVGEIVAEPLRIHHLAPDREQRRNRVEDLLKAVGLGAGDAARYPHEFSGGQRQRIGIARALAVEPRLIVCDEPVSALDVSIQAQIVNLLKSLQAQFGIAYLFIAHDLAVVEHISQRIMVMYLGKIVECAEARSLCRQPRHPYTKALISAVPRIGGESADRVVLSGDVPSPLELPAGCRFHPRCPFAEARCRVEEPPLREISPGHTAACWLVE
jgi:oligopeptide transport system ATP-binding protein